MARDASVDVAAVVPARNEAGTIAAVVDAARRSTLVREVIVVDNGSDDATAERAEAAGARVVRAPIAGKGEAMSTGVAATDASVVVFLDADLTGLRPGHVDALVRAVVDGGAAMSCGLFDRGRVLNPVFLHLLPILTGQRALRRELFEALDADDVRGYKVEAALNSLCGQAGLPVVGFVCDGLFHRTKEQKYANPLVGFATKQAMLLVACWSYVSFWARRRGSRRSRSSRDPLARPSG